jgi:magnesium transporter
MTKEEKLRTIIRHLKQTPLKKRLDLFRALPPEKRGLVLLNLPPRIRKNLIRRLSDDEVVTILNALDPDEAADIIREVKKDRRKKIIHHLNEEIKEDIEFLFRFDPKSAAGIMSLDYVLVDHDANFRAVAQRVAQHEQRTGKLPTILVQKDNRLAGYLPGRALALAKANQKVSRYVKTVATVKHTQSHDEVLGVFHRNPHNKIVVLNEDDFVLGVIYADDILKIIDEKQSEELYDFAGVQEEETVFDPVADKVKNRYKWLIVNLGTAFLAASVVGLFEETIHDFTVLAAYMPIVAGMGGNAGSQTMAVMIRGIALREIELDNALNPIIKESLAGLVNGVIIGVIVAAAALIFNHSPLLGLVAGISMVANLIIAGLFGATIPLVMERLGKDPATSATIFITTATDVLGFLTFLGLATILL